MADGAAGPAVTEIVTVVAEAAAALTVVGASNEPAEARALPDPRVPQAAAEASAGVVAMTATTPNGTSRRWEIIGSTFLETGLRRRKV